MAEWKLTMVWCHATWPHTCVVVRTTMTPVVKSSSIPYCLRILNMRILIMINKFCRFALNKSIYIRADSRFAPSQWDTVLLCNDVSYWLGASLEPALYMHIEQIFFFNFIGYVRGKLHAYVLYCGFHLHAFRNSELQYLCNVTWNI